MELSVYTNALETVVQQMLSQVYHVAEYEDDIRCHVSLIPSWPHMLYEIRLKRLFPRDQEASLKWANELYKRLRLIPGLGTTVKFDEPKRHWSDTHFGLSTHWSSRTWADFHKGNGFDVRMEGRINKPANASDSITVTLDWDFKPEGGTPRPDIHAVLNGI